MRQSWKSIVCAVCLVGAGIYGAYAQDVTTIGGVMAVPKDVSVTTASQTHSYAKVQDMAREKMQTQQRTPSTGDAAMLLDMIKQMGTSYDVYQLNGADKTGQKEALLIAVDLKTAAQAVQAQAGGNPAMSMAIQALQQGTLDTATEQLMLTTVNSMLPKTKTVIPLPSRGMTKDGGQRTGMTPNSPMMRGTDEMSSVTVEDVEPMKKLDHTKYPTYTVGSRALLNSAGYQSPYYVKAALVMNPQKPTLYMAVTSDIQRGYFSPVLDAAYRSIK